MTHSLLVHGNTNTSQSLLCRLGCTYRVPCYLLYLRMYIIMVLTVMGTSGVQVSQGDRVCTQITPHVTPLHSATFPLQQLHLALSRITATQMPSNIPWDEFRADTIRSMARDLGASKLNTRADCLAFLRQVEDGGCMCRIPSGKRWRDSLTDYSVVFQ